MYTHVTAPTRYVEAGKVRHGYRRRVQRDLDLETILLETDEPASETMANISPATSAGLMAFPLGQNSTVLVGSAAGAANPFRFFSVQGC